MTSGNGTAGNNKSGGSDGGAGGGGHQHGGEARAAQAMVKSHILTHLIEGFVIQEGAEPFPVERPSFSVDCLRRHAADSRMEGFSAKDLKAQQEPMLTCELCGRQDFAYIFKRSKRFCSTVCAKRYNVGCTKRMGLFPNRKTSLENLKKQRALNAALRNCTVEPKKKKPPATAGAASTGHSPLPGQQAESSQCSDLLGYTRPPSPPCPYGLEPGGLGGLGGPGGPGDPGQWDIQNVYQFISSLPGCLEIAEEFRSQEIDGQALLLLKEDHLMGTMNIKLGPALKIFAQISMLRDS